MLVQGGYTQARYLYASLGINARTNAVLPRAWERLTLSGLGAAQGTDLVMLNVASETAPASGSQLSPWRHNALTF